VLVLLTNDGTGTVVDIGPEIQQAICNRLGIPFSGEGSGWMWKDDETVAGQFCGDPTSSTGCSTWSYNLRTKALAGPIGPGANNGKGRGGTVAFWLGNYNQPAQFQGAYDSNGYHSIDGAVGDVFANGDVLYLKTYQQNILGMQRVRGTSVVQDVPTVGQIQNVVVRGNVGLWLDFGTRQLESIGAPKPLPIANYDHPGSFASDATGRLWICDGQEGLLLRAWDIPVGRWLSRDGFNYWQDAVSLANGKIRVVSSENQGETEGMQRVFDVDPLTGDYTLNGVAANAPLISLLDGSPATLPNIAPPAVVHTNPGTAVVRADNEDTTEMLVIIGALALLWYYWSETT